MILKLSVVRISIVLLTMPLTRFLFAAHFCQKQAKKFKREYLKATGARTLVFFAKDGERKSLQKKTIKKIVKFSMFPFCSTR